VTDPMTISDGVVALLTGGSGAGATGVGVYVLAKRAGWLGEPHATLENQEHMIRMIEENRDLIRALSERDERMLAVLENISRNIAVLVDRGIRGHQT